MSSLTPSEVGSFFVSLIGPIIIGVAAAGFTAYFALKRFYREKWWEKKNSAYGQLIDLLIDIKLIYGAASIHHRRIYEAERKLQDVDAHYFDWAELYGLKKQLRRASILAPISLSAKTKELLDDIFSLEASANDMIHEENFPEQVAYADMATDIENIIDLIVEDAKKELKFN